MPVIAITHEMGSLAKDVALELAQSMNLAVMRHEVVEHVAEKMHVHTSLINRLRGGKADLVERLTTDQERVAVYTAEEVFALASQGNVVMRGWGATCLLRPIAHVVCVRVTRSMDKRIEWLMGNSKPMIVILPALKSTAVTPLMRPAFVSSLASPGATRTGTTWC